MSALLSTEKVVAEAVEGDLFRIAQPAVHDFEVAAVRLHAENRPAIRIVEVPPFARLQIVAAIADGEIDPPVRAEGESVEIVTAQTHADPEPFLERFPLVGDAVPGGVLQHPDVRDAGEIYPSECRHHPGGGAVERVVEAVGENLRVIGFAVAIAILEPAELLGVLGEICHRSDLRVFFIHRQTFGGRSERDLVAQPVAVAAVVLDAAVEPMGLGDIEPVLSVEGNRGGILDIRLAGEDGADHVLGKADRGQQRFVRIGDGQRLGIRGALDLFGPGLRRVLAFRLPAGRVRQPRDRDQQRDHRRQNVARKKRKSEAKWDHRPPNTSACARFFLPAARRRRPKIPLPGLARPPKAAKVSRDEVVVDRAFADLGGGRRAQARFRPRRA